MLYKLSLALILLCVIFISTGNKPVKKKHLLLASNEGSFEEKAAFIYTHLDANHFVLPKSQSFFSALEGFYELKESGLIKKNILTLIDFSLSSNSKRLWVIDLDNNIVLYHTLVAHGRNTGEEFATSFSNDQSSFKSSLGFYATAETYIGKHGFSLRLDGLEKGVNSSARARAVVMHGADYVNEDFARRNNRLGRSLGCPAIPEELTAEIINIIKEKSCLYIYHPSRNNNWGLRLVS